MGSWTEANIAAWQKEPGIEPATGEIYGLWEALSQAAFELIKMIELERTGIRGCNGSWHGGDVMGSAMADVEHLCQRLRETAD
jgi:hypothetical protein